MAESNAFDACAVCGRTILRGERIAEYVTQDGARVAVCALCKPAAENAGWVPAELAGTLGQGEETHRRGLGLRERLSRASEAARALTARRPREQEQDKAENAAQGPRTRSSRRTAHETRKTRQPRGEPRGRDEGERSRDEGERRRGGRSERSDSGKSARGPDDESAPSSPRSGSEQRPPSPERLLRLAVERFNASPGPRKVAGLIRSLGEPHVAVRARRGGTIVVTVAWELSWYQWEVSADRNGGGVREARKGDEVSELALDDRSWNASVASDGKVRLELAAAREASAERE